MRLRIRAPELEWCLHRATESPRYWLVGVPCTGQTGSCFIYGSHSGLLLLWRHKVCPCNRLRHSPGNCSLLSLSRDHSLTLLDSPASAPSLAGRSGLSGVANTNSRGQVLRTESAGPSSHGLPRFEIPDQLVDPKGASFQKDCAPELSCRLPWLRKSLMCSKPVDTAASC